MAATRRWSPRPTAYSTYWITPDNCGVFYAYNHRREKVLTSSTRGIRGRPYRMNLLTRVTSPAAGGERILGLYGNQIIVYRLDGSIERIVDGRYSLACAAFDSRSHTLFLGSSISGGDGIYALHLDPPWNTKRETRHKYDSTADQIIAWAAERETKQEPFALWAGHGNDPFYMQLRTIEGILNSAPTMAKALVFPEMERTDAAMEYAVRTHIIPIAALCRKHGTAKLVLRNKNIFWNASCYLDLWRETLLGQEYSDILVPSMEETNGRTQAISLSGRMGLWLCGYFDHVSARAVTDNANFSRFWEWSSQQNLSHLFRSLALRASLGADMFLVNVYQGNPRDLAPFYQMLDNGAIAVARREDLLSVADLCLGMTTPSPFFLEHGKNGHGINQYHPAQPPAVFDRMDCSSSNSDRSWLRLPGGSSSSDPVSAPASNRMP